MQSRLVRVPRLLRALAALISLVLLLLAPNLAKAAESPTATVVELTNRERQKGGLPPLSLNPSLSQSAQAYAQILAGGSCFGHTCGPEPDFAKRNLSAGYANPTQMGENLAGGQGTPEAALADWMASPGHRGNILNPNYQEIGVGLGQGGVYGYYWVQEFGSRGTSVPAAVAPSPPVPQTAPAPRTPDTGPPSANADPIVINWGQPSDPPANDDGSGDG